MHFILLTALLAVSPGRPTGPIPAPAGHLISGRVTDPAGAPLSDVRVNAIEARRNTTTDSAGQFRLPQLAPGSYTVVFASIGHRPETRRVVVSDADVSIDVIMRETIIEVDAIQVTATPNATDALASPQPVAMRSGEELAASQSPNLGETLAGLPGVHSWSTGAAIGKPVIRGLSSNRVLVLDNGQRLETQQWGDEHSPNVETSDAERIEVIRGPASVLYGSDAIGGVVNVVRPDLPDAIGISSFVHGSLGGSYNSNNQQPDGSATLQGASGGFGFRLSGSGRTSDDIHTPSYQLWNSGYKAAAGGGTLGYRGEWGSIQGSYSRRTEHIQMTDGDPTATPNQRIGTDVGRVELDRALGAARLEIMAGYEQSRRREFEDAADTLVVLGLLQKTLTTDVHFHHPAIGRLNGTMGLSAMHTSFEKFGEETLIPENRADNVGLFAFEGVEAGRWNISAGLRYDHRKLDVDDDTDIGVTAQQRTYNAVTGNFGLLYRLSEPAALVLNVGRGFRAPSAFDLFSNGVHEGTTAFEHGDPTLKNETSLNTDLALRVRSSTMAFEFGAFINSIQSYIFDAPTGVVDSASGFEIFDVTQGDAQLTGLELGWQYHPTRVLHLSASGDYVHGQNTTTNDPLPNMPPFRITWGVRLEPKGGGSIVDPYIQVGGEANGQQTRLNPAEADFYSQAFGGAGYHSRSYHLLNAGAGLTLASGRYPIHASVAVRNILNTEYADFMSRIKTNALNAGMGRTATLRLAVNF